MLNLKEPYNSRLPATPCTEDLRERMSAFAKEKQCALAEVQRAAFRFFLANFDTHSNNSATDNSTKELEKAL